jgi:hypothetical protein
MAEIKIAASLLERVAVVVKRGLRSEKRERSRGREEKRA